MKEPFGAIAVDLGATSGRFAAGVARNGAIQFEIVRQVPHQPSVVDGRLCWDIEALLNLCREAIQYAESRFERSSLGIDAWGVDHGFIDDHGRLVQPVVCYREPRHAEVFERMANLHRRLYLLGGIQNQPFNTLIQLIARRDEDPSLPGRARWLMLPELLIHLLGGRSGPETTHASTTQLTDLTGAWSPEAFEIAGWPVPPESPRLPGDVAGSVGGVEFVRVAEHDSASAVVGMGALREDEAFLNVGTWSLFGVVMDRPLTNEAAANGNFTNERTADGRVRFLKNIPGFWVVNRLHDELRIGRSVPDWLRSGAGRRSGSVDLLLPDFFNPESMTELVARELGRTPECEDDWASVALESLVASTVRSMQELQHATGRSIKTLRAAGGGSQSREFCQMLADATGCAVVAGPSEATVLGNLAIQFQTQPGLEIPEDLSELVRRSTQRHVFEPSLGR